MPLNSFFKKLFRALKYPKYKIFFYGQIFSLIGSWIQQTALLWLVYHLSKSMLMLGVMGFITQIPALFLSPVAGVLADRFNKKKLLIITQGLFFVLAALMGISALYKVTALFVYLLIGFIFGVVSAFDMPVRQSFFAELIDNRKDLSNAVALNSVVFHGSRLIGPSIAGFAIKIFGESICFFINSVSFIPVIISLFFINNNFVHTPTSTDKKDSIIHNFLAGLAYALEHKAIKVILLFVCAISFMGMSYMILVPAFAKDIFQGDSSTLGIMMSFAGLGAFSGAIFIAAKENIIHLSQQMFYASITLGISLIVFSYSNIFILSLAALIVVGFSMMMQLGGSNVTFQTIVEDKYRGRVTSLYMIAFSGTIPLGNLFSGFLAKHIGPQNTLAFCGLACILAGLWFNTQKKHIHEKLKIIYKTPEPEETI